MLKQPIISTQALIWGLIVSISFCSAAIAANDSTNPFLRSKAGDLSSTAESERAVLIILDCSGSMSDAAPDGRSKMYAAKSVLEEVMRDLAPGVAVGLRVYGSEQPSMDPIERCLDTKLLVSPGTGNRQSIVNQLRSLKPSGATPISVALRAGLQDLERADASQKSIVLISDGMDTCGNDPCLYASSVAAGIDVQFNVVGFGLGADLAALNQLECIAKSTDGKFYTADTAIQLAESVQDGVERYYQEVSASIKEIKDDQ